MLSVQTATMSPLARLHQWDALILNRVFQGVRYRQKLTHVMATVSRTGDGPLYAVTAMAVWLAEIPRADAFCLTLILAFAIERPIYYLLKNSFKRNRPEQVVPGVIAVVVPADQFSFPSGHTSAAFCFATIAGVLFTGSLNPLFIWATAVGVSRVVLAVHFPCDVLAGAMVGSAIALISGLLLGTGGWAAEHSNFAASIQKLLDFLLNGIAQRALFGSAGTDEMLHRTSDCQPLHCGNSLLQNSEAYLKFLLSGCPLQCSIGGAIHRGCHFF